MQAMSLFFISFFIIYGGMHLYAFLRARAAIRFGLVPGVALAFFMLAMTFAPFLIRVSEKEGFEQFARVLSYVGYIWLGVHLQSAPSGWDHSFRSPDHHHHQ